MAAPSLGLTPRPRTPDEAPGATTPCRPRRRVRDAPQAPYRKTHGPEQCLRQVPIPGRMRSAIFNGLLRPGRGSAHVLGTTVRIDTAARSETHAPPVRWCSTAQNSPTVCCDSWLRSGPGEHPHRARHLAGIPRYPEHRVVDPVHLAVQDLHALVHGYDALAQAVYTLVHQIE